MPRLDRELLRLPLLVKKKYQRVADLVTTYGDGILVSLFGPGPHPWELIVGLAQNADRSELRQSARLVVGIRNAFSPKIDKAMWQAICETQEQVNEAQAMEESVLEVDSAATNASLG